jgi:hypothetical protein
MTPDTKAMAPADQAAAQKVVLGCSKLLFAKETHDYLVNGLKRPGPIAAKIAAETVGVMKLFASRVKGEIPRQVLLPAATMLVMEIARFAGKAGFGEPSGKDVKDAIRMLPALLMKAFPPPAGPAAPGAVQPAAPAPGGMIGG